MKFTITRTEEPIGSPRLFLVELEVDGKSKFLGFAKDLMGATSIIITSKLN